MPNRSNRVGHRGGLCWYLGQHLYKQTQCSFKKSSRRQRSFILDNRNVPRFDSKALAEFSPGHIRLLAELRDRFPEIKQMAGDRILRIGRHILVVKLLEIVLHR